MAQNGTDFKIYVTSSGSVQNVIAGNISASLTHNGVIVDTSNKDSGWASNLGGEQSWSVSGSFTLEKTNPVQETLAVNGLYPIFVGEVSSTTATYGWSGTGRIESIGRTFDKDGMVTLDIAFTGSGTLTKVGGITTTIAPTTTSGI